MGIIQSAINQTLRTASIALRIAPGTEERVEKAQIKRDIKKLNKVFTQLEETGATEKNVSLLDGQVTKVDQQLADKYERLSQLEPTKENIESVYQYQSYVANMQKANQRAADIQAEKQKQKESFNNFTKFITDPGEVEREFKQLKGGLKNGK